MFHQIPACYPDKHSIMQTVSAESALGLSFKTLLLSELMFIYSV